LPAPNEIKLTLHLTFAELCRCWCLIGCGGLWQDGSAGAPTELLLDEEVMPELVALDPVPAGVIVMADGYLCQKLKRIN